MNKFLLEFERFTNGIHKRLEKREYDQKAEFDLEDELKRSSKKHHYIPRYFINGFTDNENLLYIYDKQRDAIKKNKIGSGGIFYEEYRNSLDLGNNKYISIFEDMYCFFDNELPSVIKLLRSNVDSFDYKTGSEIIAYMNIFILDLFLRNKNNDAFFDQVFETSTFEFRNNDLNQYHKEFKEMSGIKKLFRLKLFTTYLNEIFKYDPRQITNTKVLSFERDQICIGDQPMLFLSNSGTPHDLFHSPLILPISKSKIYLRNVSRNIKYGYEQTSAINGLIIDQSSNIIACSNRVTLEDGIKAYKFMKNNSEVSDLVKLGLFSDFKTS
ncbi:MULTISPECIES: DUF4238 domain-containing protein [Sphingobacterium]|uniref:DUF4238 domain-containing protein n=1 Tax=Sphingobacterium populi TaxID=1812824 RepID=A0ABW5UDI3_9SPHI|nr:DUF4238 domain-containing protein [Sphingobacterium sp. CFCC 11742]